jgi:hypothetical protein
VSRDACKRQGADQNSLKVLEPNENLKIGMKPQEAVHEVEKDDGRGSARASVLALLTCELAVQMCPYISMTRYNISVGKPERKGPIGN